MAMSSGLKRLPAVFFRAASGAEPVRDWLKAMPLDDRRILGRDIATAEFGWPIGMPLCRALGEGLWEIRCDLPGGRTARVLFCAAAGHMVLLHAFVKKTQRAPSQDLALARKRMKELAR